MPAAPDGPSTSVPMPATLVSNAILRGAIIVTSSVGVLAVVVSAYVGGGLAALGAALGAIITVTFFASGQWGVTKILARDPQLALSGALLVYLTQIAVLFLLIALLQDATWLNPKAFAVTIVVLTVTWVATLVWGNSRYTMLIVDPVSIPHAPESDK